MTTEKTAEAPRGQRKTRVGVVVSDKMDKTVVVSITRRFMHTKYKKYVKTRTRFKVHDPNSEAKTGDRVLIEETRPLSKDKRWKLKEIVEKAPVV
jgi:small subunit ribosomal protein S17